MRLSYRILAGLFLLAPAACERGGEKEKQTPAAAQEATTPDAKANPKEKKETFGSLSIDEVAARVGKKGVYLIDNNPREVWEKGHVPTATWVDYETMTAADLPADKSATLIFYCANEH